MIYKYVLRTGPEAFFKKSKNHTRRMTPLSMLEIVMLHQIPFRARGVWMSASARGIRMDVNRILTTEGGRVCPYPQKAPAVVISTLMNNWDTPNMIR